MSEYVFRPGTAADVATVAAIYSELVGTSGCTWNEFYPTAEDVELDVKNDGLFVLEDGRGVLIAAIACEGVEEEMKACPWSGTFKNPAMLSRLGVKRERNGQGIGRMMMERAIDETRKRGYDGIEILVSPINVRALHIYESMGFMRVGETYLFDTDWLCEELAL